MPALHQTLARSVPANAQAPIGDIAIIDEHIIVAVEYGHTALLCSVVTSRLAWSHKNHPVAGGGEP